MLWQERVLTPVLLLQGRNCDLVVKSNYNFLLFYLEMKDFSQCCLKKKSISNIPEQVALSKSIMYCLRIQHRNDSMRTYLTILIECYFIPIVFVLKNIGHNIYQ